jgi:hypothetical protein
VGRQVGNQGVETRSGAGERFYFAQTSLNRGSKLEQSFNCAGQARAGPALVATFAASRL